MNPGLLVGTSNLEGLGDLRRRLVPPVAGSVGRA